MESHSYGVSQLASLTKKVPVLLFHHPTARKHVYIV